MPVRVQLATADGFALGTLLGDVTWAEIAAAMRALYGRSESTPHDYVLWDGRRITTLTVSPEDLPEIQRLRDELKAGFDGGKTAAVMVRGPDQTLARLFGSQVRKTRRQHRVFASMDDALAFLGRESLPEFDCDLFRI